MTLNEYQKVHRLMISLAKRYRPHTAIWCKSLGSFQGHFCYVCLENFSNESLWDHSLKDLEKLNLISLI